MEEALEGTGKRLCCGYNGLQWGKVDDSELSWKHLNDVFYRLRYWRVIALVLNSGDFTLKKMECSKQAFVCHNW